MMLKNNMRKITLSQLYKWFECGPQELGGRVLYHQPKGIVPTIQYIFEVTFRPFVRLSVYLSV